MANIKSAKKRIRQTAKRRRRNLAAKRAVKDSFKKAVAAIAKKDPGAKELIKKAVSIIDKAAQRGIIHKNKAARKKSRLLKKVAVSKKK